MNDIKMILLLSDKPYTHIHIDTHAHTHTHTPFCVQVLPVPVGGSEPVDVLVV